MRRALPMLVIATLLAGACSGSDDTADTTLPSPDTVATTSEPPATEAPTTTIGETTTTDAPTTTIDDATLLAEAEAAYLEAFEVALESIRNPDAAGVIDELQLAFTDSNLEQALENHERAIDAGVVAKENATNPSFATIVQPAAFVDGAGDEVLLGVCEFNSDRIFEVGTAPDGGDSLLRDDPVSLLFAVRMKLVDGMWKSAVGTLTEEVSDEEEQCSSVS